VFRFDPGSERTLVPRPISKTRRNVSLAVRAYQGNVSIYDGHDHQIPRRRVGWASVRTAAFKVSRKEHPLRRAAGRRDAAANRHQVRRQGSRGEGQGAPVRDRARRSRLHGAACLGLSIKRSSNVTHHPRCPQRCPAPPRSGVLSARRRPGRTGFAPSEDRHPAGGSFRPGRVRGVSRWAGCRTLGRPPADSPASNASRHPPGEGRNTRPPQPIRGSRTTHGTPISVVSAASAAARELKLCLKVTGATPEVASVDRRDGCRGGMHQFAASKASESRSGFAISRRSSATTRLRAAFRKYFELARRRSGGIHRRRPDVAPERPADKCRHPAMCSLTSRPQGAPGRDQPPGHSQVNGRKLDHPIYWSAATRSRSRTASTPQAGRRNLRRRGIAARCPNG